MPELDMMLKSIDKDLPVEYDFAIFEPGVFEHFAEIIINKEG